jgi:hypothetical protein
MERIILTITSDLFDDIDPRQEVSVRTNVSIRQLITAARREFNLPRGNYVLHVAGTDSPLEIDKTLEHLGLQTGAELIFERDRRHISQVIINRGGGFFEAITTHIHATLREESSGEVFEITWQPAIIGRPDASVPASAERLAVNLGPFAEGRTVSRQHARITERGGRFFLEGLAERNPTFLNEEEVSLGEKREVKNDDRIRVGKITLILNVQEPEEEEF